MKKFTSLLCALVLSLSVMTTAFATEIEPNTNTNMGMGVATETVDPPKNNSGHGGMYHPVTPEDILDLDPVTTDDVQNKINQKGQDIIDVIINVCQKICVVTMPLGAVMFLVGLAGNKKTSVAGAIMFIFSGVCYAAITCAPELTWYISSWLMS